MSKEYANKHQYLIAWMMYLFKLNGIEIDTAVSFVNMAIKDMVNTKLNPGGPVAMYESAESGI